MVVFVVLAGFLICIVGIIVCCYFAADKVPRIRIRGAKVVVTGGSDGLGLHMCQQLVQRGANVIVIARNQTKLNTTLEILQKLKGENQIIGTISADVSDADGIKAAVEKANAMLSGIDVFINNAGITHPGRFEDLEMQWFQKCMNVNYYGNINAMKAVLPIMKAAKKGRIIAVSSVVGLFGCMGYGAYTPSKAAIISLYETLQQEYYAFGISFSVATPASIGTTSFYEEEQKLKPAETLELERDDPILPPEVVATPIIDSIERWNFLVSPSGFNSHVMTTACAGFAPASFSEVLWQVFGSGLFRFIGLFAFNSKARALSIAHRSKAQK